MSGKVVITKMQSGRFSFDIDGVTLRNGDSFAVVYGEDGVVGVNVVRADGSMEPLEISFAEPKP